jgi:hypothetical protein
MLSSDAQEADTGNLDVTMTLLPENAVGPEEITRRIELPSAPPAEREAAGAGADGEPERPDVLPGLENGRGAGLDTAVEARERGRAFGQEVAEAARESRDDAGRRDDRGPPDGVSPGPPDTAGPPNAPPGRPTP